MIIFYLGNIFLNIDSYILFNYENVLLNKLIRKLIVKEICLIKNIILNNNFNNYIKLRECNNKYLCM